MCAFKVDVLRRAMTMATERKLDHLTLFGDVEMVGFWEKVVVTFFGMAFHMATAPSEVINPKSGAYVGVGAFQLLKRSAYEAAGTHRRLAMEVVDDMKLGKIVKQAGFRSGVGVAQDFVVVRWHAGARNLINGVTKNFFAGSGFSVTRVALSILGLFLMNVLPFAGAGFWAWLGEDFCRDLRGDCAVFPCGRGYRDARVAAVLFHGADWRGDIRVHAAAIHDVYAEAGRNYLARDVLSAGGAKTWRGVILEGGSRDGD